MLILLSLIPALTLIHFWQVAADAQLVTTAPKPARIPGGMWDWNALTSWNNPADICSEVKEENGTIRCEGRTTILPGFEPTVFAVLTAAAVLAMLTFWWFIIVGKKVPQTQSHLLGDPFKPS